MRTYSGLDHRDVPQKYILPDSYESVDVEEIQLNTVYN
jgi:hypothetical protein